MIRQCNLSFPALIVFVLLNIVGCASDQPAPVIERAPSAKKPAATVSKPIVKANGADWRPDTHIVKKGDTLYSIGLQYGYDYKEIAQENNIPAPYTIHVGQQLKIKELKAADNKVASSAAPVVNDNGVVVSPLKTDGSTAPASVTTNTTQSVVSQPPLLTEPKAIREPYSEQAMQVKPVVVAKPVPSSIVKPIEPAKTPEAVAKPDAAKADAGATDDDTVDWGWPTAGKVITTFNDSTNAKGIDIAGTSGQAVNASAAGKVIYSGSDLRGYGKLVIIKHNKTYLSVYAHNSQILVKEGQAVNKGQKIAEMGNTDADQVKLHFEIRQQGKSVDPSKFLSSN